MHNSKTHQKPTTFRPSKSSKFQWSGFDAYFFVEINDFRQMPLNFSQIIDKIPFWCYNNTQKSYV